MTGARGTLGPLSGGAWVRLLSQAGLSGTLLLSKGERATLFVLGEGRVQGWDVGAPYGLGEVGGRFAFWPHAERPQPSLEPRYPKAAGPLRALPALLEEALLSTAELNVRALFARLAKEAFSGALVFERPHASGVVVVSRGRPAAAALEARAGLLYGPAALRPLLEGEAAALSLYPLPEPLCSSFLALVLAFEAGVRGGRRRKRRRAPWSAKRGTRLCAAARSTWSSSPPPPWKAASSPLAKPPRASLCRTTRPVGRGAATPSRCAVATRSTP
ncbi:hypothetical protein [Truepera radiovictrix]|uniref:Uncharacterized protein n=1 Tax=Truepera radiovictrix (strain DSM 17093 / CIP 108686 / LMG 22925 / RQ-24) TaxID=649638 RepID=D7CVP1_TRURR|nr:hypothetical protein [Truepera radiovictrix]ADI15952.1 hypothetical protein Trad_2853 [Truepera radiovictrix DSM 17093]